MAASANSAFPNVLVPVVVGVDDPPDGKARDPGEVGDELTGLGVVRPGVDDE
jgi:hypothetical protein